MSEIKDLLSLAAKTTAAYNLNGQMVYVDNDGNHRIIQETNVSPARKPTHVLLTQVGGFMEYVRAHSGKVGGVGDCFGAPRVFASIEPEKCELELVAYLDFFQVDPDDVLAPAQRDYSATFRPRLSEPFRAWVGYDGRNMP